MSKWRSPSVIPLFKIALLHTQETQVSGAVKQTHRHKQHTDTHTDKLTDTMLERLQTFWKPDVCLCLFMNVYTKTGLVLFVYMSGCMYVCVCCL